MSKTGMGAEVKRFPDGEGTRDLAFHTNPPHPACSDSDGRMDFLVLKFCYSRRFLTRHEGRRRHCARCLLARRAEFGVSVAWAVREAGSLGHQNWWRTLSYTPLPHVPQCLSSCPTLRLPSRPSRALLVVCEDSLETTTRATFHTWPESISAGILDPTAEPHVGR
jgi:hypothetical protein